MALRDMSEKKMIIITIIVAVVVSIPCWVMFYLIHDEYTIANAKWEETKQQGINLEKELKDETDKAAKIDQARQTFEMQRKMLPEKDEIANFFQNDLPSLLKQNEFKILSLSMSPKVEAEKMPKGVPLNVNFRTIEIRISGTYQGMIKLLKEIEEGREVADPTHTEDAGSYRLFRVQAFDFSPSGEKTLNPFMQHQARILLNAFYIE